MCMFPSLEPCHRYGEFDAAFGRHQYEPPICDVKGRRRIIGVLLASVQRVIDDGDPDQRTDASG